MLDELGIPLKYTHAGSAHSEAKLTEELLNPLDFLKQYRIIFLHRDPRDVVVSGYFQATKRIGVFDQSLSVFLRDPRHGIRKIVAFNNSWLTAIRTLENVCIVRYEDLQSDTGAELRRITGFLRLCKSDQAITKAVEAGRFETMKEKEASGAYASQYGGVLTPGDVNDLDSFKVRRGVVGGYVDYFSEDDLTYCEEIMRNRTI